MNKEKFDQGKYQASWDRQNMRTITAKYRKDFVEEFKQACKSLGITQSEVIREAMKKTIDKANKENRQG